jgi:large subunit ribosomal protein L37Ae
MAEKKTKAIKRLGSRYGKGIRDRVEKTERDRKKQTCPKCGKNSVKRKAYGVWKCSKCGAEFAGGAYSPVTDMGRIASRVIKTPEKAKLVMEEYEETKEVETPEKEEKPGKKEKPKTKKEEPKEE